MRTLARIAGGSLPRDVAVVEVRILSALHLSAERFQNILPSPERAAALGLLELNLVIASRTASFTPEITKATLPSTPLLFTSSPQAPFEFALCLTHTHNQDGHRSLVRTGRAALRQWG